MLNYDGVISTVLMTDEAHFHFSGYVNKQNYRYLAPESPQELHHRPLHRERLAVWWGITTFGVLGPCLLEDNKGADITVTSERNVAMLRNFCAPQLRCHGTDFSSQRFQQGATTHTARESMSVLPEMIPQKVISVAAMFHDRLVHLVTPHVITLYGVSQKQSFHL